jgi:signal transduction histidine kinase
MSEGRIKIIDAKPVEAAQSGPGTGAGIPQKDLERIVMPFAQARQTNHIAQEEAGFGLSIVNLLVALHGGTLRIESELRIGTKTYIRLPGIS